MAVYYIFTVMADVLVCRELGYKDCFTRIKYHGVTTMVVWCGGVLMCAGENHISILPERFPHLPGQAKIHMYSCDIVRD